MNRLKLAISVAFIGAVMCRPPEPVVEIPGRTTNAIEQSDRNAASEPAPSEPEYRLPHYKQRGVDPLVILCCRDCYFELSQLGKTEFEVALFAGEYEDLKTFRCPAGREALMEWANRALDRLAKEGSADQSRTLQFKWTIVLRDGSCRYVRYTNNWKDHIDLCLKFPDLNEFLVLMSSGFPKGYRLGFEPCGPGMDCIPESKPAP